MAVAEEVVRKYACKLKTTSLLTEIVVTELGVHNNLSAFGWTVLSIDEVAHFLTDLSI